MTGTVIRIKGLKRYRHPKTGIMYTYHRATGKRLKAEFGTAEFISELAALDADAKEKPKPTPIAGTIGGLFEVYRRSAAFEHLKPRVRKGYEEAIAFVLERIRSMPLSEVTPGFIAQMRDKITNQRSWHFANEVRKVLSVAFSIACESGIVTANPVKDTKRAKRPASAPRRNRPWSFEERFTVMRRAPNHLKLPVALAMYMGWARRRRAAVAQDCTERHVIFAHYPEDW
jgi:hypothetical protein